MWLQGKSLRALGAIHEEFFKLQLLLVRVRIKPIFGLEAITLVEYL